MIVWLLNWRTINWRLEDFFLFLRLWISLLFNTAVHPTWLLLLIVSWTCHYWTKCWNVMKIKFVVDILTCEVFLCFIYSLIIEPILILNQIIFSLPINLSLDIFNIFHHNCSFGHCSKVLFTFWVAWACFCIHVIRRWFLLTFNWNFPTKSFWFNRKNFLFNLRNLSFDLSWLISIQTCKKTVYFCSAFLQNKKLWLSIFILR